MFMKDSGNIKNNLEMCKSGRNEGPTVVMVDKSSKSPLFNGGRQFMNGNKEVRGNGVAIEEKRKRLENNKIIIEGFDIEHGYPTRE